MGGAYGEAWVGWAVVGDGALDCLDAGEGSSGGGSWDDGKDAALGCAEQDWSRRSLGSDQGEHAPESKHRLHLGMSGGVELEISGKCGVLKRRIE